MDVEQHDVGRGRRDHGDRLGRRRRPRRRPRSAAASSALTPARNSWWSSTTTIRSRRRRRVIRPPLYGRSERHFGALTGASTRSSRGRRRSPSARSSRRGSRAARRPRRRGRSPGPRRGRTPRRCAAAISAEHEHRRAGACRAALRSASRAAATSASPWRRAARSPIAVSSIVISCSSSTLATASRSAAASVSETQLGLARHPRPQRVLLAARQPRDRRRIVGLALDERERLQHRVVQVRREPLALLLAGASPALSRSTIVSAPTSSGLEISTAAQPPITIAIDRLEHRITRRVPVREPDGGERGAADQQRPGDRAPRDLRAALDRSGHHAPRHPAVWRRARPGRGPRRTASTRPTVADSSVSASSAKREPP